MPKKLTVSFKHWLKFCSDKWDSGKRSFTVFLQIPNRTIKKCVQDDDKSGAKWGNCTGSLVYQHNIIISVRQALQAAADITTSVDGHLCVTCIRVESLNRNKSVTVKLEVNRRKDGSIINAKLKFNGFHLEQLSYSVRMWAVNKIGNSCSFVP